MAGTPSVRRDRPVSETTAIFEEMLVASEEGQRHCLRVKLDMSAPNKALRDPVAYRCNLEPHWRTGQKYKVCARWQVGDLGHRPHLCAPELLRLGGCRG